MRLFLFILKCLMVIVIVLAITSYVSYLRTGQFWVPNFSIVSSKLSLPSFKRVPEMQTLELPREAVYKWKENGEWVYGDAPPANVDAQRVGGDN